MQRVLELEYTAANEFVCPMADSEKCGKKGNGSYRSRKGLIDHINHKHSAKVIWICSVCFYKGKGRYSYREVKQHYYVTHANTAETIQSSGSTEVQILRNQLVKEYKNQHIEHQHGII